MQLVLSSRCKSSRDLRRFHDGGHGDSVSLPVRGFCSPCLMLHRLLCGSAVLKLQAGKMIIQKGADSSFLGIVLSGQFNVIVGDVATVQLNPGQFIGPRLLLQCFAGSPSDLMHSQQVKAAISSRARARLMSSPLSNPSSLVCLLDCL